MERAVPVLECLKMASNEVANGRAAANQIYKVAAEHLAWFDANTAEPDPKAVDKARKAA